MPSSFQPMQLLTPLLLLLIGTGMGALWARWRERKELGWMGLGFLGFGLGLSVQVTRWPSDLLPFVLTFSICYLLAVGAMARALAQRLRVAMPWRLAAAIALGLLALQYYFSAVQPNIEWRIYIFSGGAMLLMGSPLLYWKSMQPESGFDHALRWAYVISIASFLLRTLLLTPEIQTTGNGPLNPSPMADITQTWYWISIHFSALISVPALATIMALAVGSDVIKGLKLERNRDALTHLLNRRGFDEQVHQNRRHAMSQHWSLLLCDLDHFKTVNDNWGHAAGDQVLKTVSNLLRQHVRADDVVARIGGEEFLVLLSNADGKQALHIAERIRHDLSRVQLPIVQGQQITLSIGGAELDSLDPNALCAGFKQADSRLYRAKHDGRNRICMTDL